MQRDYVFVLLLILVIFITSYSIYSFYFISAEVYSNHTIRFDTYPLNSGNIYCNGEKVTNMTKVYGNGTEVNCKAVSKEGSTFQSWSGISFQSIGSIDLTILNNGTLTANFSKDVLSSIINFFSLPIVLLIIGAAITSYVIPLLTRQWQEYQKQLELQVNLVVVLA